MRRKENHSGEIDIVEETTEVFGRKLVRCGRVPFLPAILLAPPPLCRSKASGDSEKDITSEAQPVGGAVGQSDVRWKVGHPLRSYFSRQLDCGGGSILLFDRWSR